MAKTILIELRAEDKATAKIKNTEEAVKKLGQTAKSSVQQTKSTVDDTIGQLEGLGNRFRYLSLVTGIVAAGTVSMMKSFAEATKEMEAATLRLGVYAESSGQSLEKARDIAFDLADTGFVSAAEAANSLSNLLATGLGLDQSQILLKRMLDTAVLSKESLTDTFGKALEKSTLGIRILQERQVDAIGVNFTAIQVWREYGKTLGKTTNQMTTQEKQTAIINYLMKETERFVGGADIASQTFGGTLSRLNASFFRMKVVLGETIVPIIGTLTTMLSFASEKIRTFAENHAALSSVILTGATVFGILIAAVATLGALIPMLVRGFSGLSAAALMLTTVAGLKMLAIITAISVAIGGLIYLALKVTGQWDKWRNSMSSLTDRIKAAINPFKKLGDTASEADEKIAKQIKKLQENMKLATRDFREGMAEWAQKHDETVKDLRKQISDLQKDYSEATSKIRKDFKDTMTDLELSHTRKTEDLQRELDEEVSKGIWADQTRIRDIQLRLKRENEDYARSTKEKGDNRDEDLIEEKTKLDEKLIELQAKLDKELEMEQKHSVKIAEARTWPILDEIEKRTRAFDERMEQYREELAELQKTSTVGVDAFSQLSDAYNTLGSKIDENTTKTQNLKNASKGVATAGKEINDNFFNAGRSISNFAQSFNPVQKIIDKLSDDLSKAITIKNEPLGLLSDVLGPPIRKVGSFLRGLMPFQEGGIIPGSPNQPIPIMAHGGETVLPAGVEPVTININNPTVRNEQDIMKIADAVKAVLSRQQYLRHMK